MPLNSSTDSITIAGIDITCPLTKKIMAEPVILSDGHTYEKEALEEWLQDNNTSPTDTQTILTNKLFFPNHHLNKIIINLLNQPENATFYAENRIYLPTAWKIQTASAVKESQPEQILICLAKDPRLLFVHLENDYTAFHIACQFASPEIVDFLLTKYTKEQLQKIMEHNPDNFNQIHLNTLLQQSLNDEPKFSLLCSLGAKLEQSETDEQTQQILKEQSIKLNQQDTVIEAMLHLCCNTFTQIPSKTLADQLMSPTIRLSPDIHDYLFNIVLSSRNDQHQGIKAAHAITILNKTRFSFSGKNLTGVNIAGADLSYGIFDGTIFENANLSNVNFTKSWLANANFKGALMSGVIFEFEANHYANSNFIYVEISSDGKLLATINNKHVLQIFQINHGILSLDIQIDVSKSTDNIIGLQFCHNNTKVALHYSTKIDILNILNQKITTIKQRASHFTFIQDNSTLIFHEYGNPMLKLLGLTNTSIASFKHDKLNNNIIKILSIDQNNIIILLSNNILLLNIITKTFSDIKSKEHLHAQYCTAVILNINDQQLAAVTTSGYNNTGHIFIYDDINNGKILKYLETPGIIYSLAFLQDYQLLIAGSIDNYIYIFNYETTQLLTTIKFNFNIKKIISTNDNLIVSYDSDTNIIRTWKINQQNSNVSLQLLSASTQNMQYVSNANLDSVKRLALDEFILLKQHNAIGELYTFQPEQQENSKPLLFSSIDQTQRTLSTDHDHRLDEQADVTKITLSYQPS